MIPQLKLTDLEKKQLLLLSRDTLRFCFEKACIQNFRFGKNRVYSECQENLTAKYSVLNIPVLQENLSCFVTLYKHENDSHKLRGCIGTIEARNRETLMENLIDNSINAAFGDSRFEPIEKAELETIAIEISILSKPERIEFNTKEELFSLIEGKGVVLQLGTHKATFLPQVWEQIDGPENFLLHLSRKAGISVDDYLRASYKIYDVFSFEEEK